MRKLIVVLFILIIFPNKIYAQAECNTVKDCADKMVQMVREISEENQRLEKHIAGLEAVINSLKQADQKNKTTLETLITANQETIKSFPFSLAGEDGICPAGMTVVGILQLQIRGVDAPSANAKGWTVHGPVGRGWHVSHPRVCAR